MGDWQHLICTDDKAIAQTEGGGSVTVTSGNTALAKSFCDNLMTTHDLADMAALIAYLGLEDYVNGD